MPIVAYVSFLEISFLKCMTNRFALFSCKTCSCWSRYGSFRTFPNTFGVSARCSWYRKRSISALSFVSLAWIRLECTRISMSKVAFRSPMCTHCVVRVALSFVFAFWLAFRRCSSSGFVFISISCFEMRILDFLLQMSWQHSICCIHIGSKNCNKYFNASDFSTCIL